MLASYFTTFSTCWTRWYHTKLNVNQWTTLRLSNSIPIDSVDLYPSRSIGLDALHRPSIREGPGRKRNPMGIHLTNRTAIMLVSRCWACRQLRHFDDTIDFFPFQRFSLMSRAKANTNQSYHRIRLRFRHIHMHQILCRQGEPGRFATHQRWTASDRTGRFSGACHGAHEGEQSCLMPYGKQSDVALSDTGSFNAYNGVSYLEEARGLSLGRAASSSLDLMMQRVDHLRTKKYQSTALDSNELHTCQTSFDQSILFPYNHRNLR